MFVSLWIIALVCHPIYTTDSVCDNNQSRQIKVLATPKEAMHVNMIDSIPWMSTNPWHACLMRGTPWEHWFSSTEISDFI